MDSSVTIERQSRPSDFRESGVPPSLLLIQCPLQHGALECKGANGKQACAFPGNRQLHYALLPVTSLMRKRREELWAPPPPEYRKLLRLKAGHQSAGYSAPLHEERLRASLACCFSHCKRKGSLAEAAHSLPVPSVQW